MDEPLRLAFIIIVPAIGLTMYAIMLCCRLKAERKNALQDVEQLETFVSPKIFIVSEANEASNTNSSRI